MGHFRSRRKKNHPANKTPVEIMTHFEIGIPGVLFFFKESITFLPFMQLFNDGPDTFFKTQTQHFHRSKFLHYLHFFSRAWNGIYTICTPNLHSSIPPSLVGTCSIPGLSVETPIPICTSPFIAFILDFLPVIIELSLTL